MVSHSIKICVHVWCKQLFLLCSDVLLVLLYYLSNRSMKLQHAANLSAATAYDAMFASVWRTTQALAARAEQTFGDWRVGAVGAAGVAAAQTGYYNDKTSLNNLFMILQCFKNYQTSEWFNICCFQTYNLVLHGYRSGWSQCWPKKQSPFLQEQQNQDDVHRERKQQEKVSSQSSLSRCIAEADATFRYILGLGVCTTMLCISPGRRGSNCSWKSSLHQRRFCVCACYNWHTVVQ